MNNNIINKKFFNIYIFSYVFYIILTTLCLNTSYSLYFSFLHNLYKFFSLFFILLNFAFLPFLKDNSGKKSRYDYWIAIFLLVILFLRIIFGLRIIAIDLIPLYLFLINLRYVNLNKFIRIDFKTKLFLIVSIIALFIFHLTPYSALLTSYRHGIIRISAGFGNYNIFSSLILCLIYSFMLYEGKRLYDIRNILIILIVCIVVFLMTDTRGFIVSGLSIPFLLIIGKIKIIHKVIEKLSLIFIIFISAIAVIVPINISPDSDLYFYGNKLLANRLAIQHLVTTFFPIKFTGYGNDLESWLKFFNYGHRVFIDNTYLMLLVSGGIIGFVIFEYIFIKACYISCHNNKYILCVIFVSMFLLFVTEDVQSNIFIYIPVICAYDISYYRKQNMKKEFNRG